MDVDKVLQALGGARLSFQRGFPGRVAYWPTPERNLSDEEMGSAEVFEGVKGKWPRFKFIGEDGSLVGADGGFVKAWVTEALVVGGVPHVQVSAHHIVSRGAIDDRIRQDAEAAIASWLASANELLLSSAGEPDPEATVLVDNDRWLIWISLPEIIKHVDMAQGVKAHGSVAFYYTCEATCLIVRRTKS